MRAAILALALMATGANAQNHQERWLEHIEWITANSPLEYNGEPLPDLVYVSRELLMVLGHGPETVARAERDGRELFDVLGVYDDFAIYLPEGETAPEYVEVHELVHFLQDVNGTTEECIPANEPQAYRLQDEWMAENGIEEGRPNMLFVLLLQMSCDDHRHGPEGWH